MGSWWRIELAVGEVRMSVSQVVPESLVGPSQRTVETTVEPTGHTWRLSGVEFEDGVTIRCFECAGCGAVRYS